MFRIIIGMPIAGGVKIILAKWLPVIGPPADVRAPGEPLLLDLELVAKNIWGYVQRTYAPRPAAAEPVAAGGDESAGAEEEPAETQPDIDTENQPDTRDTDTEE